MMLLITPYRRSGKEDKKKRKLIENFSSSSTTKVNTHVGSDYEWLRELEIQ